MTSPAAPQLNPAERIVWDALQKQLGADAVLIPNLRVASDVNDHEIDILVLLPDAGVVVLEVKGGAVSTDQTGQWWQTSGSARNRIDPVNQAMQAKHAARRYLEAERRWASTSRARVRWAHAVVVPYTRVPDDFAHPDCPRTMLIGQDEIGGLRARLHELTDTQETGYRRPTADDVALIHQAFTAMRPMTADAHAAADERSDNASRLTQEQSMLLDVTRLLNRVEVRGGAGSGKTMMAVTQATRLTRGGQGVSGKRVALLCYSYGLASFFTRYFSGKNRKQTPAFHGTFESFGNELGIDTTSKTRDDGQFWEHDLPEQMALAAENLTDGKKYDAIIVDEAQDFADSWWMPLLSALKDPLNGGLYAYSDENQRVFARFGRPPVPLVPLLLDHNLRNTKQIAESFAPLAPGRMRALGGDGPDVSFVPAAADDALGAAEEQVLELLEEGWPADRIALITTGTRHPKQIELQERLGQSGYWQTFWDNSDVFYGHVLGCKGLERQAVVLCLNERGDRDRARERLYVGMSRATDRLIVVGDPAAVRTMGGDRLARALDLHSR